MHNFYHIKSSNYRLSSLFQTLLTFPHITYLCALLPKVMKTLLKVLLSVILIFLSSCEEKKSYFIGVSQCSSDDWRDKMNNEVLREAMLHDDIEVEIISADDNSEKQISDL